MSGLEQLSRNEAALRDLIRSGCYDETRKRLADYVGLAERVARDLPGSDVDEFAARIHSFLDWAFRTVSCRRAHLAMQHGQTARLSAYGRRSCCPATRLCVSA